MAGAKDHPSHRLVTLGLSERGAVMTLYLICLASGSVAYLWERVWPQSGPGFMLLFLVVAGSSGSIWQKSSCRRSRSRVPTFWPLACLNFSFYCGGSRHDVRRHHADPVFSLHFVSAAIFRNSWPDGPDVFLSAALAVAIKLPLLAIFSVYRGGWTIRSLHDVYPIIKASVTGMLILVTVLTFTIRFREFREPFS